MSAIRIDRGQLKDSFVELRRQFGEHHLVSSTAGIGLAFRETEIRLWAPRSRWRMPGFRQQKLAQSDDET